MLIIAFCLIIIEVQLVHWSLVEIAWTQVIFQHKNTIIVHRFLFNVLFTDTDIVAVSDICQTHDHVLIIKLPQYKYSRSIVSILTNLQMCVSISKNCKKNINISIYS